MASLFGGRRDADASPAASESSAEATQLPEPEPADGEVPAEAVHSRPPRDPMVTTLVVTILLILVLTLVTVFYALLTDVLGTGAPRTIGERKIMAAAAKIDAGSKDGLDWRAYIFALTDEGQYREAQSWIDKGKKRVKDDDINANMLYAQANLYAARDELDKALETADAALKQIKDRYEAGKAEYENTGKPDPAYSAGLVDNYWELLLLKAEVYEKKKDWGNALAAYDEYLANKKTAATVFTQRGVVREQMGDKAGAEADFRQTLIFISDDAEALAGLERIGVAK